MRKKIVIAGLAIMLCVLLGSAAVPARTQADPAAPPPALPKVYQDCAKKDPNLNPNGDPNPFFVVKTPIKDDLDFRVQFETARYAYQSFTQCVFDKAVTNMLNKSSTAIFAPSNPNLPDFLKPEIACLTPDEMYKIISSSDTNGLIAPMLNNYNNYVDYLKQLKAYRPGTGLAGCTGTDCFSDILSKQNMLNNLVDNEIQDSIVALSTAFSMLQEFREAYVMHVHFQCALYNLGKYRDWLGKIRTIVETWPRLIDNASMHR